MEAGDTTTAAGLITIVPADDHEVVRSGLRMMLEADRHALDHGLIE